MQAPLVADLADQRLLGRYMALSALSWQVGFTLGPAIGGFALDYAPYGLWLGAAAICAAAGLAALALERVASGSRAAAHPSRGRLSVAERRPRRVQ